MSLQIGIVGLPNVGKSTLFNALTKNNVLAANYPFATIEPNTGVVPVPDERLNKLGELFNSQKILPATVTFVDIAGLVAGAHKGEGMGNAFLSHIRETDAIAQVVRAFEDDNVQHVAGKTDPLTDIETVNTELVLADIQTIDKRLPNLRREAKGDPKKNAEVTKLESLRAVLDEGTLAVHSGIDLTPFSDLHLLTAKSFIYVFNVGEDGLTDESLKSSLRELTPSDSVVFVSAKIEHELSQLDDSEAKELMREYGLSESGLERLSRVGYETLGLQSFLTAGEKEARAWTIKAGFKAPQAAGVIHSDFERGFIAADVVDYDELVDAGSWSQARQRGKVRTEGKEYVMQPNDVVEFKFNV